MSAVCTPVRNPLREIKPTNTTPSRVLLNHQKPTPRTPKLSPGPALLLAISLSAKKEECQSRLGLLTSIEDKENEENPKPDVSYFRKLLSEETQRITVLCNKWDAMLMDPNTEQNCSDAIMGDIRTTVGQGRLIMRERFHQFEGLVDNCEFRTSEKPITCQDLQGFWDMIYFQVEDVDLKFAQLEKCRMANWDSNVMCHNDVMKEQKVPKEPKKKIRRKVSTKTSEAAEARKQELAKKRAEARKRLAAAKAAMKNAVNENVPEKNTEKDRVTFDAGFFQIDSPVKSPLSVHSAKSGICVRKQVTTPSGVESPSCNPTHKRTDLQSSGVKSYAAGIHPSAEYAETPQEDAIVITKRLEFETDTQSDAPASHGMPVVEIVAESCNDGLKSHVDGDAVPSDKTAKLGMESTVDIKVGPVICDHITSPTANTLVCEDETSAVPGGDTDPTKQNVEKPNGTSKLYSFKAPVKYFPTSDDSLWGVSIPPPSPFDSTLLGDSPTNMSTVGHRMCDDPPTSVKTEAISGSEAGLSLPSAVEKAADVGDSLKPLQCIEEKDGFYSREEKRVSDVANLSVFIDEASKNLEKVSEILCPASELSMVLSSPACTGTRVSAVMETGTSVTPSLGGKGKPVTESLLQETLERMIQQMAALQRVTASSAVTAQNPSQNELIEQLQNKIATLETENISLSNQLEQNKIQKDISDPKSLIELLFKCDGPAVPDCRDANSVGYDTHYFRAMAQVKLLETQLKAYKNLQPDLKRMKENALETVHKLDEKTKQLEKHSEMVRKNMMVLKEEKDKENFELMEAKSVIDHLTAEVEGLKAQVQSFEASRQAETSTHETLAVDHRQLKSKFQALQSRAADLTKENTTLTQEKLILEENLTLSNTRCDEESEKVKAFESTLAYVRQELNTAFADFQSEMEKQENIISAKNEEYDKVAEENTKLTDVVKMLRDKVETLEYVEDERQSLQEQLAETEHSVQKSVEEVSHLNGIIAGLKMEAATLKQELQNKQDEYQNLQEELDVAKVEAHLMVLQRQEEIVYGNSGMKNILEAMYDLRARLSYVVKKSDGEEEKSETQLASSQEDVTDKTLTEIVGQIDATLGIKKASCKMQTGGTGPDSSANGKDGKNDAESPKEDSLSWKVDKGLEVLESISSIVATLQTQFQQEIDQLCFKNSVLNKQLAAMKDRLADFNDSDNELERLLRSRIESLTKEREEKADKLEANIRMMHMLSDQNMELTEYKYKYEQMMDEIKSGRKGRSLKRRSSSAGSLRFPQ